jgi:hypothetical protein
VREIFRLIDWMMHLRADLDERFEQELMVLEESLEMPYVTSVERIAEARGKKVGENLGEKRGEARGQVQGGVAVLINQLIRFCGPLGEAEKQGVARLSIQKLVALGEALLDFRSVEDLRSWLDQNAGGESDKLSP